MLDKDGSLANVILADQVWIHASSLKQRKMVQKVGLNEK